MREATIGLTVIDDSGPEPVLHSRCWQVPPDLIDGIAVNLTLRYGEPDELISDPRTMVKAGQRSAEDGAIYLMACDDDG